MDSVYYCDHVVREVGAGFSDFWLVYCTTWFVCCSSLVHCRLCSVVVAILEPLPYYHSNLRVSIVRGVPVFKVNMVICVLATSIY